MGLPTLPFLVGVVSGISVSVLLASQISHRSVVLRSYSTETERPISSTMFGRDYEKVAYFENYKCDIICFAIGD